MKKIVPFIAAILIVPMFFISCKKSDDTTARNPSTLIKTAIYSYSTGVIDTANYTYDSDNRIAGCTVKSPGSSPDIYTYAYNGSSSYTETAMLNSTGTPTQTIKTYLLNSNQLVDSIYYNTSTGLSTAKYIYNSNNQLIDYKAYIITSSGVFEQYHYTFTYDASGNLLAKTALQNNGSVSYTESYTYSSINYYIDLRYVYMPKLYHNLPLTMTQTNPSGGVTGTLRDTYSFDSDNRVTRDSAAINYAGVSYTSVSQYIYY